MFLLNIPAMLQFTEKALLALIDNCELSLAD